MSKRIGRFRGLSHCCERFEMKIGCEGQYHRCVTCRYVYVDWDDIYCTLQDVCDGDGNIYVGDGTVGSVYKCSGCSACCNIANPRVP
jgi:hypothetical protein